MWVIKSINYVRRGAGRDKEVIALAAVALVLEARRLVPADCVDGVVAADCSGVEGERRYGKQDPQTRHNRRC